MQSLPHSNRSFWAVFLIFFRLGLTSFGGPVAHLGYFRSEFVTRRHWLSERSYADLVALCQFLPGPASSQVGMALGYQQAGVKGAFAAWCGFTLPSAVALIAFALGLAQASDGISVGFIHGLKVVAVAVVAQAVWGMGRSLCPDGLRLTMMVAAASILLVVPTLWTQLAIIGAGGCLGLLLLDSGLGKATPDTGTPGSLLPTSAKATHSLLWLGLFGVGLLGLPIAASLISHPTIAVIDAFYRAGSLVFGGGHVVLPLLQSEVVPTGWVAEDTFLAGYGAAQAVPGPLFTFAAFLGASLREGPSGWLGGLISVLAIFAPSFLLVIGVLPHWDRVRHYRPIQAALSGVNATVVGILLAALYRPVWTSAIFSPLDCALALTALLALIVWKLPPWVVVVACGGLGHFLRLGP